MHGGFAWLAAALCFGLGDLITTVVGTRRAGLCERAPVARCVAGSKPPIGRLVALKAGSLLVAYALTVAFVPSSARLLVPVSLAVIGVAVSGYNVQQIRIAAA